MAYSTSEIHLCYDVNLRKVEQSEKALGEMPRSRGRTGGTEAGFSRLDLQAVKLIWHERHYRYPRIT